MKNIAASLSFFSALVDCNKSLLQVIINFVSYALASKKQYSFSVSDATAITNEFYSFEFPDAVLKRACTKMVRDGILSKGENATYIVNNGFNIDINKTEKIFSQLRNVHNEICNKLYLYGKEINKEVDKNEIVSCLLDFILFDASQDKYSNIVSTFLISIENDKKYINYLNSIRPALIIYKGICATPIFNEQSKWNDELNLFLNTDILFSAYGLNGAYKKKLFDDFYGMIKEINTSSLASKNKKLIRLYYFDKIKDEIDSYYHAAGQVVQNKTTLVPNKKAMAEIVKGCGSESDVIEKKSKFMNFLGTIGINNFNEDIDITNYVVESSEIKYTLGVDLQSRDIQFNEVEVDLAFSHLTRINALRKGKSACPFGKAKFFFVTDKFLTNYIASHEAVKFNPKDIPLSTSIDFLTAKFWFALGKCLSKERTWAAFDVIINAKLAIESDLNDAIEDCFQEIKGKLKKGEITKDEACLFYMNLRKKSIYPEAISDENIDEIIAFCTNDKIEILQNEHSILNNRLKEAEKRSNRLIDIYKEELFKNNKKSIYRYLAVGWILACHIGILIVLFGLIYLISTLLFQFAYSEESSVKQELTPIISPGILQGIIANFLFLLVTVFDHKKISLYVNKKMSAKYRYKLHRKRQVLKKKYFSK